MSNSSALKRVVVQVNVIVANNRAHYITQYDNGVGINPGDAIYVAPGTLLAWVVNVFPGPQPLPYKLQFSDSGLFGVGSLDVPHGGFSPFLQVLALTGRVKYTLTVPPLIPALDPDILVGSDAFLGDVQGLVATYAVTWDTAVKALFVNGNPFPANLAVNPGDKFTFTAMSGGAPVGYDGQCNVPYNATWFSPFNQFNSQFSGSGTLIVGAVTGKVTAFPFYLETVDLSAQSNTYTIAVNQPPAPAPAPPPAPPAA